MSLSNTALEALNEHWAVAAIGADELERAEIVVRQLLARRAAGKQISFSVAEKAEDVPFLEHVALAFELAAIEGTGELGRPTGENRKLRDQAIAASLQTFDILRLLPVPEEALRVALSHLVPPVEYETDEELFELCRGMAQMAPGAMFASSSTVENSIRVRNVIAAIEVTIQEYPPDER